MVYGGASIYLISHSDASGSPDFTPILAPFLKCSEAADAYSYSSAVSNVIKGQACAPQAGPLYFFLITALFVLVVQCFGIYAYAKEGLGGLYLTGIKASLTFAMLLIGIYVMAVTTNSTAVQCVPCDGHLSASEQATLNGPGIPGVAGRCMNGIAGTNTGANKFITAIGSYYVGSAIGLLNMVLWQWLLAYIFGHREQQIASGASHSDGAASSNTVFISSAQQETATSV